MSVLAKKFLAKFLVIPVIFGFALSCCHTPSIQAFDGEEVHAQNQSVKIANEASSPTIQEGHHCSHEQQSQLSGAVQTPSQQSLTDHILSGISLSVVSFHQCRLADSPLIVSPRITGPPWDGKSIKAFLGVYRS